MQLQLLRRRHVQVRMPGDQYQYPQGRVPPWACLRLRRRLHLPGLIRPQGCGRPAVQGRGTRRHGHFEVCCAHVVASAPQEQRSVFE